MNVAEDERTLEAELRDRLADRGERLAVVETCTGGLVGATLTGVPGSSDVLDRVLVPYDYDALRTLTGVDRETLDEHGAVSEAVTAELAKAARDSADVTWGVANTGIAGPGGGTESKPVGTAFVGVAYAGEWESGESETTVERYQFDGDRAQVREGVCRGCVQALTEHLETGTA